MYRVEIRDTWTDNYYEYFDTLEEVKAYLKKMKRDNDRVTVEKVEDIDVYELMKE